MWKDRARILMFALEGLHKNSNVCKKRARIPMFDRFRSKFQCVKNRARIPKISVKEQDKNSSVYKNRSRSPMFQKMTSKFQSV